MATSTIGKWLASITGNSPLKARPPASSRSRAASLAVRSAASERSATAMVGLLRQVMSMEVRFTIAHEIGKMPVGILDEETPCDAGDDLRRPIFKPGDAVAHGTEARDGAVVEDVDAA